MSEHQLFFASFDDSCKVQDAARAVMPRAAYKGWEVRTWLQGERITTTNDGVAELLRAIAKLHDIPVVEGDDIPEDPGGWFA